MILSVMFPSCRSLLWTAASGLGDFLSYGPPSSGHLRCRILPHLPVEARL